MKIIKTILAIVLLAVLLAIGAGCSSGASPTTTMPPPPPAVKLVFTSQPAKVTAGLALDPAPVVAAADAAGNIVANYSGLVKLTITEGSGTADAHLFGGTSVGSNTGSVTFKNITIDKVGAGYTLTATSGKLVPAISVPFAVSPGAPYQLVFTTQPTKAVAGATMAPPVLIVQDSYGNNVTNYDGSVTLAVTSGTGPSSLSGTKTVRVVNNTARFTDISLTRTFPQYTLTATSGDLVSAVSSVFEITPAASVKLQFTVQPSGVKAGTAFETQPKVAILDVYGNVTDATNPITVAITPGTGAPGAVLSGTKTLVADGGVGSGLAEFDGLSIDLVSAGYTLTATSSGLTPATSEPFDVTP